VPELTRIHERLSTHERAIRVGGRHLAENGNELADAAHFVGGEATAIEVDGHHPHDVVVPVNLPARFRAIPQI